MGSECVFDRADVREIRKDYGLHELDPLPLRLLPESLFTSTYEVEADEWPDFIATDIADWPCRQRKTDGAAASGHDVALVIAFTGSLPALPKSIRPMLLRHQTSGHWQGEFRCAAIHVSPSARGREIGTRLAIRWHGSGAAAGWITLDGLSEYRSRLQSEGLDCNESYRHFAEGAYPIDLDDVALGLLVEEGADVLRELCPDHLAGACLVFLAPNSELEG